MLKDIITTPSTIVMLYDDDRLALLVKPTSKELKQAAALKNDLTINCAAAHDNSSSKRPDMPVAAGKQQTPHSTCV